MDQLKEPMIDLDEAEEALKMTIPNALKELDIAPIEPVGVIYRPNEAPPPGTKGPV